MKNSSDTIGNRTRDLPDCSAVPQPPVPPRTQLNYRRDETSQIKSIGVMARPVESIEAVELAFFMILVDET
jgi:hypothetical protein